MLWFHIKRKSRTFPKTLKESNHRHFQNFKLRYDVNLLYESRFFVLKTSLRSLLYKSHNPKSGESLCCSEILMAKKLQLEAEKHRLCSTTARGACSFSNKNIVHKIQRTSTLTNLWSQISFSWHWFHQSTATEQPKDEVVSTWMH